MSQVIKKHQKGGSLTIDGIKYDATPEFINALTTHLRDTAGTDAQTLAGLSNALQDGQDLRYDSAANTISGMYGDWSGITDRQNNLRGANSSRWRKWWEAQFDTDAHRFRNALSAIGSFHYQVPKATEETPTNLKDIYGDTAWFDYIDKDGTKVWSENSAKNAGLMQRLDDMSAYLSDPEAGKKIYKLASQYTPEHMSALQGLYNQSKDRWADTLDQIKTRAKNNQLGEDDIKFLNNFFIAKPDTSDSSSVDASGLTASDRLKWNNAGHGGLADLLGNRAHINDDGSISLNDGESWGWNLGDLEGRNIWFNDDFYNSRYGADGSFDPYRNYTLYNNRLYALDNPTLARILNADGGFNSMMKSGNWTGADNQILTRFTDLARENPIYLNPDQYSTFLSTNPNYRFSDLTGLATTNGMTDDQQLIQYVNLGDDSLEGPYRRYNYKYALLNNRGGLERELTPEEVIQLENGQARETGLNTYKRTVGKNNGAYNNRYYEDLFDKNKQATGFRFYRSIENPDEDVILHMPQIYANGTDNQDIVLPKEIAQILMNNIKQNGENSWLSRVIGNAQNKKNFMTALSTLVQSGFRQGDNEFWNFSSLSNQFRKMGFSEEEIKQLVEAIKNNRKGSRADRRNNMLVNAPQFEKNGGVLKDQKGGIAGGAKTATGVTERIVNTTNTNPKNAASVAEIGGKNWTDADTADMIALATDLGSLTTAFIPGANIASVATGAAGSTARLYADLSRGTKGAIPNYLLNLGMDATMLLPVLGGMGKLARIPKAVKSALPTIIKAASVYGLGAGVVETAKKIASGQKFTTRDVDMLVNAITAGVGIGKSGGFGRSTKTTKTKAYSENFKIGDSDITLDDAAIKKVLSASDQPKALREAIKAKAPNASDKDIAAAAESLLKEKKTLWQRVRGKDGDIVVDAKKKPIESTTTEQANGNKWHDWWYGVGDKQSTYNAQLRGEKPTRTTTKAYELTRTDTDVYPTKPRVFRTKGPVVSREIPLSEFKGRQFSQEVLPGGFTELNGPGMIQNPGRANYIAYTSRTATTAAPRQGIALPQPIIPLKLLGYEDQQPSGAVMQPLFKKGGKIEKGQSGLKPVSLNDNDFTNWWNQKQRDDRLSFEKSINSPLDLDIPALDIESKVAKQTRNIFTPIDRIDGSKLVSGIETKDPLLKQSQERVQNQIQSNVNEYDQGTFSEQKWNPDLNVPLNWARSLYAMKQSDKQLENFLNRPHYQMQGPILNAPRYINTGTGNAYRTQADNTRISKPVTSDAMQNDLMQRSRQQEARQLELQGALADSQEYGQYKAGLDEFTNNNILRNTDIANQNGQLRWQHELESIQAKNANIAEKSKFFDQAAYATQDWWNRNYQTRQQLNGLRGYNAQLEKINRQYVQKMNDWKTRHVDDPNGEAAAQELAGIKTWLTLQQQGLGESNLMSSLSPWFRRGLDKRVIVAKSGSKVSSEGKRSAVTYSKDPYPELLLQNTKDSSQAVKQLNDAIIKLLLQTKPINVH